MEILTLKFVSPTTLNELGEARQHNPEPWLEEDSQDKLKLDTTDWTISSSTEQAIIDQWEVNEDTHRMRIKSGNSSHGFKPLDYPFAVSMIGQIGNKKHLQDYLDSLQKIYLIVVTEKHERKNSNPQNEQSYE